MGNSNKKLEDFDVVHSFHHEEWKNKDVVNGIEIWENERNNIRA